MQASDFDIHNPISIKDLIRAMDLHDVRKKPVTFSLIAISCNYSRNEGGNIIIFKKVVQYRNVKIIEHEDKVIEVNPALIASIPARLAERVRRLYDASDDTIRNVNIRYITHFKGNHESKFRRIIY